MAGEKKFYCRTCDREITAKQKKNYRGLCPECSSLVEIKKDLKFYLIIGVVAIPLLSLLMWFAINFVVLWVEDLTSGDFFSEWVEYYSTYNFLKKAFEFIYHPISFSVVLGCFSYTVIFKGVRNMKGLFYYITSFLIWIIITVIYVFLVITRFS